MSLVQITKVTASSDDGNVPANVIDNNTNTRWSAEGIGEWIQLEIASAPKQIKRVEITYYKNNERIANGELWIDNTRMLSFTSNTSQPVTIFNLDKSGQAIKIVGNGNSVNKWNSIVQVKVFADTIVTPPPPPPPTGLDAFGIKMINPTKTNGRVFNAPLNVGVTRTLRSNQRDGNTDLIPLGNATYTITPSTGEMKMNGTAPRVYVYDSQRIKMFENVEITCYYKSVTPTSSIARGYQGFEIAVRGQHELAGTNARVYYSRHSLNGTWWRLKEDVHPTSKDVATNTNIPFYNNIWYGMKFVVRTLSNGDVQMQSYRDTTDGTNGGTWIKMFDFTDKQSAPWNGWPIYKPSTPNCGCHSSFTRTDNHTDFRIKKWSIREI